MKKRFTEQQIVAILKEGEAGADRRRTAISVRFRLRFQPIDATH